MRLYFFFSLITLISLNSDLLSAEEKSKPNVLFLICDDLNCDLGCYGHPLVQTPNIDRLAKRGLRFESAYCQYPLCGPSRASFMTGLYPNQSLVRTNPVHIRDHVPDVVTLSQLFRQHHYQATRIGKIFHYGVPKQIGTSGFDDPASWDDTINPRGRDKDEEPLIFSVKPGHYGGHMSWLAAEGTDEEQTDGIAATNAVQLIKKYAADDRNFFLAVGLYRPHTPYVSPRKYFEKYPLDSIKVPKVPQGYLKTLPLVAQKSIMRKPEHYNISTDLARQAIQAYYASVTFADAQVGRILDALDESGITDNTIVVFTSDHGYHLGEHGHWLKTALFDNATRVPLIIAAPGVSKEGTKTSALAELVDIYPTLAELCQFSPPDHLSGISLVPILKDSEQIVRHSALTQLKDRHYTIRTGNFRYTEWGNNGSEGRELYDHRFDRQEMKNIASNPEYLETKLQLSKLLRKRVSNSQKAPKGITQVKK